MINTNVPRHLLAPLSLALFMAGLQGNAWSQALPPAGQVGKEGQAIVPPRETSPVVVAPVAAPASAVAAVSVKVSGFKFVGNKAISDAELQTVVADSVDQTLGFAALDQIAAKVSRHYRRKGYTVATAYLPPQQSKDGSIQIAIIEGQYGEIKLDNKSAVESPLILRLVANSVCDGVQSADCKASSIEDAGIERAVLLVKDLPGIAAASSLKPGVAVGTSDLEIRVKDVQSGAYSVGLDNFGSKATGVIRWNASAEFNNPTGAGDQLTMGLSTTGKSNTGSVGYSLPVGYGGGRMGLAFARGQYRLGGGMKALLSHGTSNTASVFGLYPVVRSINRSVYLRGSAEVRGLYSSIDSVGEVSKGSANILRAGVNGDNVDALGGGGYTVYGLMASSGNIGLGGDPYKRDTYAQTAGHFSKITYSIARQQAIAGPITMYASLYGQDASKNLDASEQIGIAGPTAVRGYAGEGGGSVGAVASVELRYTTFVALGDSKANLTYAAFVDRGWVDTYKITSADLPRYNRALTGYGLSATLQSSGYYLKGTLAWHNKNAPSTVDTDTHKFWLQAGMNF